MPTLQSIYLGDDSVSFIDEDTFMDEHRVNIDRCPNCGPGVLELSELQARFSENISGRIFDPNEIRVGLAAVVADRLCISLKVVGPDNFRILAYRSSGKNFLQSGKMAGEWHVFFGFAENGWFAKTRASVAAANGLNQFVADLTMFLGLLPLGNSPSGLAWKDR